MKAIFDSLSLPLSPTIIVDSFCLDDLTVLSNSSYLNLDVGVNDLSLLAASRLGQLLTTDHLWIPVNMHAHVKYMHDRAHLTFLDTINFSKLVTVRSFPLPYSSKIEYGASNVVNFIS